MSLNAPELLSNFCDRCLQKGGGIEATADHVLLEDMLENAVKLFMYLNNKVRQNSGMLISLTSYG